MASHHHHHGGQGGRGGVEVDVEVDVTLGGGGGGCAVCEPGACRRLHTHPHHRDPEFDARALAGAARGLWVVTAISNPVRFKTRYALYRKFRDHVTRQLGLPLVTVEAAYGDDRDHQVCDAPSGGDGEEVVVQGRTPGGVRTIDVRVRNRSQVWLKENLWNVGARALPHDCKYVLFCDADVEFTNRHVATEIVHALQEYRVVQPFETVADLGPDGQIMDVHRSFGWCHANGWEWKPQSDGRGGYYCRKPKDAGPEGFGNAWHPGYAIAFRRGVLDRLGLLETGVLGAGDMHAMAALVGKAHLSYPPRIHKNYKKQVLAWQTRAAEVVDGELGFVPGTLLHHFHGSKADRKYVSRWTILVEHQFDPEADVYRNAQGVMELEDRRPGLRDAIKAYFRQRNEDGVGM